MSKTQRMFSFGLFGLICIAGCGGGAPEGPPKASVQGTVSFDGVSIDNGAVAFEPTGEAKGPGTRALIVDGKYSVPKDIGPVIGTNIVRIEWSKKTGETDAGGIEMISEGLPAKFNSASTLQVTIKAGENKHDFALTSK